MLAEDYLHVLWNKTNPSFFVWSFCRIPQFVYSYLCPLCRWKINHGTPGNCREVIWRLITFFFALPQTLPRLLPATLFSAGPGLIVKLYQKSCVVSKGRSCCFFVVEFPLHPKFSWTLVALWAVHFSSNQQHIHCRQHLLMSAVWYVYVLDGLVNIVVVFNQGWDLPAWWGLDGDDFIWALEITVSHIIAQSFVTDVGSWRRTYLLVPLRSVQLLEWQCCCLYSYSVMENDCVCKSLHNCGWAK